MVIFYWNVFQVYMIKLLRSKYCFVVLFLVVFRATTFSQGYIPVTTTMRTPMGNVPYTYQVYSPMNYYRNIPEANLKGNFIIVLKNDSTFHAHGRVDMSDSVHRIEIRKKKMTSIIRPEDTKQVTQICGSGLKVIAIPADSCWLFPVHTGKINAYSILPYYDLDPVIVAIQKGENSPIIPLTKKSLREMVGDDPKLNELIEKEKFDKAIRQYNKGK